MSGTLSDSEAVAKLLSLDVDIESLERSLQCLDGEIDAQIKECERVSSICANARQIADEIDNRFLRLIELNEVDYKFLVIATVLQAARWVLIDALTNFGEGAERDDRLDHDDRGIKSEIRESEDAEWQSKCEEARKDPAERYRSDCRMGFKSWQQILEDPVPFDTIKGSQDFVLGLNGKNHRERTLGHDPLLGWIFGTVNIMTDTTTMRDLRTFVMRRYSVGGSGIAGNLISGRKDLAFAKETTVLNAFRSAYCSAKEDRKRIGAALVKESVHLKSDFFTKCGLPIPVIEMILPDLSSRLYEEHYDALCLTKDVGIIGLQAVCAVLVNFVISFIHGLYYDPKSGLTRELYEVKTRKILLFSNSISSAGNIIAQTIRSSLGDHFAWRHLDFGGIAVTLWRIITDVDFMRRIREEYLRCEFRKLLMGSETERLEAQNG